MAGDDCSAGFAIFPIIMIVFFLSILSRALRGAGGYSGGYSSGYRSYRRPGMFYALQYLDNRRGGGYGGYNSYYGTGISQPYSSGYSSYSSPQPAYREQPPPGVNPSYGAPGYWGYQPPPPAAYQSGPAGYRPAYDAGGVPGPAYSSPATQNYPSYPQGPAPEAPKVSCSYCGSLNPAAERNCLLCGAPMK